VEVRVPDLGNFKDVAVIDVLVKPGESVAVDTRSSLSIRQGRQDVPSDGERTRRKDYTPPRAARSIPAICSPL